MSLEFVQMADPQFGMFAAMSEYTDAEVAKRRARGLLIRKAPERISGFADESRLYGAAIRETNRIAPAFAVVCGDMVHDASDRAQVDELFRITSTLDANIPIHFVAGNHDVGDAPTSESLARYRERFGADNYSFDYDECHFAVINSSVAFDPSDAPREWSRLSQFLADDLAAARRRGARRMFLFTHHPLFTERASEPDSDWTIPTERRDPIVRALREYGVSAVFAGHMHRNIYASDAGLSMITSGAVGYPFGEDPSGLRVVSVDDDGAMRHRYYGLDAV